MILKYSVREHKLRKPVYAIHSCLIQVKGCWQYLEQVTLASMYKLIDIETASDRKKPRIPRYYALKDGYLVVHPIPEKNIRAEITGSVAVKL